MWQTIVLSFLAGPFGGHAFPHFVKGITKEPYPTVFGSSPVINFVAGWVGLLIATLFLYGAHMELYPVVGLCCGAVGVFLAGLLRAWYRAVGK